MRGVVFLLWLVLWGHAALEAARLQLDPGGTAFRVVEWDASRSDPDDWAKLLFVHVEPHSESSPAVLGEYALEGRELVFRPRFPLEAGVRYRAFFRPPGAPPVEAVFEIPRTPSVPTTTVVEVYPTAASLPENNLKFYIHFSAPMGRGEAFRRIRLLDKQGRPVELPFLELQEELWDPEGKRLTVLFDPGRIKRGLAPNREVGPPIVQGRRYTLVIDATWPDAEGRPLKEGFLRSFAVKPAERRPVSLGTWRVTAPSAGSTQALTVVFPRPMDRALLDRLIEVLEAAGLPLEGSIQVDLEETRWKFTPRRPWHAGGYRLRVDTALEDIAGNKVDRPFDVDVFERVADKIRSMTKTLPFTVK